MQARIHTLKQNNSIKIFQAVFQNISSVKVEFIIPKALALAIFLWYLKNPKAFIRFQSN